MTTDTKIIVGIGAGVALVIGGSIALAVALTNGPSPQEVQRVQQMRNEAQAALVEAKKIPKENTPDFSALAQLVEFTMEQEEAVKTLEMMSPWQLDYAVAMRMRANGKDSPDQDKLIEAHRRAVENVLLCDRDIACLVQGGMGSKWCDDWTIAAVAAEVKRNHDDLIAAVRDMAARDADRIKFGCQSEQAKRPDDFDRKIMNASTSPYMLRSSLTHCFEDGWKEHGKTLTDAQKVDIALIMWATEAKSNDDLKPITASASQASNDEGVGISMIARSSMWVGAPIGHDALNRMNALYATAFYEFQEAGNSKQASPALSGYAPLVAQWLLDHDKQVWSAIESAWRKKQADIDSKDVGRRMAIAEVRTDVMDDYRAEIQVGSPDGNTFLVITVIHAKR